jgi:ParB/RepB/Spo0J family partition protein
MDTLAAAPTTRWIDLSLIDIPKNARPHRPEDLESLAQDMAKEGQLQEIVVVAQGDRFEVVAGVGRTLAAQNLKWDKIRCFVKDSLSEFDRLHITFSENEEREDASPLYQAQLLKRMQEAGQFKTQDDLADKIGKSRGSITQYLVISRLEPQVQESVNRLTSLGMRHLLEICRLKTPEEQIALAKEASEKELSVKKLKAMVDKKVAPIAKSKQDAPDPRATIIFTAGGPAIKFSGQAPKDVSREGLLDLFREKLYGWMGAPAPQENSAVAAVLASDDPAPADSSPRIPKTPEEQAELEALAAQSPHAVYQWIFGSESFLAKRMATVTWQSMGITDPKQGLKQILEGVKVVAASQAARKKRQ